MKQIVCSTLTTALLVLSPHCPAVLAQGAAERDIIRVREGTQDEPWLRIDAAGHTAAVRALAFTSDSSRLCSGGLDKNVEVWNMAALRDLRRVFLRERTIRWQVARGLRGSIYALAAAPDAPLLAIGGYGAMGSLGEIVLVNPIDGKLVKVLQGHRQTICSLAFSPDGKWLASMDTAGETRLWKRSDWSSRVIYHQDSETYGAEAAAMIARQTKLRPLAFLGSGHIVLPTFASNPGETRLRWRLVEIKVADPTDFHALDTIHYGLVTALAASADGKWMASADAEGTVYLWDRAKGGPPDKLAERTGALSMCFSPDGRKLVAGTLADQVIVVRGVGPDHHHEIDRGAYLQIWDVANRAQIRATNGITLYDNVYACAISPDGKRVAYAGGAQGQIYVKSLTGDGDPTVLQGTGRRIGKVAFALEEPYYRVAFGMTRPGGAFNDYGDLKETFDTTQLSHSIAPLKPGDWISPDWLSGGWTAKPQKDGTLQLYLNGAPQGTVAFGARSTGFSRNVGVLPPEGGTTSIVALDEGTPQCYCWISDAAGKPFAIAVGTDVQDSIYICRLTANGPCPILRHFRGHNDRVTSLGVSRDLRYLVSGSADGTVRFWNLAELAQGATPQGRWGAHVRRAWMVSSSQSTYTRPGRSTARGCERATCSRRSAGRPIVRRNPRRGPDAMLEKLQSLPWGTQVLFEYSRNGAAQKTFQLLPAWEPLATLFAGSNGEWAFWTPAGYYDASMNGYRLFGWQVNRGLERLPDYYRADQFYRQLERPRVMERLLPAGNLRDALDQASASRRSCRSTRSCRPRSPPRRGSKSSQPAAGTVLSGRVTKVQGPRRAAAGPQDAPGQSLRQRRGRHQTRVAGRAALGGRHGRCKRTDLSMGPGAADRPQGPDRSGGRHRRAHGGVWRRDRRSASRPNRHTLPEMYVLCVGINRYADPKINPLGFPVADAEAVADAFRKRRGRAVPRQRGEGPGERASHAGRLDQGAGRLAGAAQGPRAAGRPGGVLPCRARHRRRGRRRSITTWDTTSRWPTWAARSTRIAFPGTISPGWPTCPAARSCSWTPATAARSSPCARAT